MPRKGSFWEVVQRPAAQPAPRLPYFLLCYCKRKLEGNDVWEEALFGSSFRRVSIQPSGEVQAPSAAAGHAIAAHHTTAYK